MGYLRPFSVTRRHIAFLFESYPDHLKRPKPSNEAEIMCGHTTRLGDGPSGCYKCELNLDELGFEDGAGDD